VTYLTSAEVAELLKVSPKTISRWALEYAGYAPRALGPVRLIRDRVLAGLRRAKAQGVRLGRPRTPVDMSRVLALRAQGCSMRAISRTLGLSAMAISRALSVSG